MYSETHGVFGLVGPEHQRNELIDTGRFHAVGEGGLVRLPRVSVEEARVVTEDEEASEALTVGISEEVAQACDQPSASRVQEVLGGKAVDELLGRF